MIRHIVFFRLREFPDPQARQKASEIVREKLLALKSGIPFIADFRVGINFTEDQSAYDLCIDSTFRSREDLEAYRVHPEHQEFIRFNKDYSVGKAVVDYEIP